jgi:hypothetical protein
MIYLKTIPIFFDDFDDFDATFMSAEGAQRRAATRFPKCQGLAAPVVA